jgi:hypothetical protein
VAIYDAVLANPPNISASSSSSGSASSTIAIPSGD